MTLRVLAWDHPRATLPLAACSRAWSELTGEAFAVETRSLAAFGDATPEAGGHDLVLIDHPHLGKAAMAGAILPLDDLVGTDRLATLESDAVGPAGVYRFGGVHWAIAVDAACQALALGAGNDGRAVPVTWSEVLELARELPGRVALPLHPAHAISALLSLLAAGGHEAGGPVLADGPTLERAVRTLAAIAEAGPPDAYGWEPPEVLARLASGELTCVPLTYAYVGYEVSWHDAPRLSPEAPPGSILGGVGVAVLAGSADPSAAARLAAWLASPSVQHDIVGATGGQPASRAAWDDPAGDPMFAGVRHTIDRSRVRPRDPWWPAFQREAGERLALGLRERRDAAGLAHDLELVYRDTRSPSP